MWTMRKSVMLGAVGAMLALPIAAQADPPAVGAPTIPPVFVGAPTNDNPNAGEFTVNFDSTGYRGIGTSPEPPLTRDLTEDGSQPAYRQAGSVTVAPTTGEKTSVDRLFVGFAQQLRDLSAPQAAYRR